VAYLFRLILLCIPLFGAVAATAEVQRFDRGTAEVPTTLVDVQAEQEMVLALNTVATPSVADNSGVSATAADLLMTSESMTGAGAGLPMCLALVLLVTLVRQRT